MTNKIFKLVSCLRCLSVVRIVQVSSVVAIIVLTIATSLMSSSDPNISSGPGSGDDATTLTDRETFKQIFALPAMLIASICDSGAVFDQRNDVPAWLLGESLMIIVNAVIALIMGTVLGYFIKVLAYVAKKGFHSVFLFYAAGLCTWVFFSNVGLCLDAPVHTNVSEGAFFYSDCAARAVRVFGSASVYATP